MSDKDAQLAQFTDVTGANDDRARFYLESSGWQLEMALASYYENENEMDNDSPEIIEQVSSQMPTEPTPEPEPEPQRLASGSKGKGKSKNKSSSSNSRVRTLASLHQDSDSDDSGQEEGQAFYAGGSDSSGQQILGPSKNKEDLVRQMFKSVQEQGAEVVEPGRPSQSKPSTSFHGKGYRLGQSPDVTEEVGNASASRPPAQVDVVLKMWREGFSVNDGPVRKYSDPENREFLECIRKGEVPRELIREARGSEVHVNMEDHSHEDPPAFKPKVKAFAGRGNVLGSPAPNTETATATASATAPLDSKAKEDLDKAAKEAVPVDSSQPATTVQVRLADGSVIVARLNHSHTVADLRRYISSARPQYANIPFSLHTTFPRKELNDDVVTIQAAGLLNAAVLQRLG